MINFTVLGGYLGAGKTSLLNHILRHNPGYEDGQRFALLINDFGDINIDAQLIESQTDRQINLANGCVCCTLSDGFDAALETLCSASPPPDHIFVEASGVADVHNLSQYGHGNQLRLASVVVVVDAETVRAKANDKYVAQTIRRQLKSADLLILNKTDLLTAQELANVQAWLREETDDSPLVCAVRCEIPLALLLDAQPASKHLAGNLDSPHTHEAYCSWSFDSSHSYARARVEAFMHSLGPEVIRAKGLIADDAGGTLELQVVGRRRELIVQPNATRSGSQIVVIGLEDQLDPAMLDDLVVQHLDSTSPA